MAYGSPTVFALSSEELNFYRQQGYLIVRQLLSLEEVTTLCDRFDAHGRSGKPIPGWSPNDSPLTAGDALARYPRMMMPHRFDDLALRLLLDARLHDILATLLGDEPIAAQSMYYFKPPGAKGQAFHQDDFYLKTRPASCLAAWMAIDPSLEENGGLYVVPGSHRLDLVCPEVADPQESFSPNLVRPPAGMSVVPANLAPGDVLFFGGNLIHGSLPNRSNHWRRSYICHYLAQSSSHVSEWYFPLLDFNGNVVQRQPARDGGPCGG